jgi:parvulin-like peptidyl-prolyl isomerase
MTAEQRWEFATDPKRIAGVLNGLLVTKTLAAQARAHGTKVDSAFAAGPADESERALATAELRRIEETAGKAFDADRKAHEAKARELYDIDREKYRVPEEIRLSDIAVAIKDRGDDAALARAREARAKLVAGADFATLAREYSDDPTTKDKGGALPFVTAKQLAPEYAKAVFALTSVGTVSEPIKAPAAYHVVRLEERRASRIRTFDEVRPSIVDALRKRYIDDQREARIQAINRDPGLQMNQPAIDALVQRIDPKLREQQKEGGETTPAPGARPSPPAASPAAGATK